MKTHNLFLTFLSDRGLVDLFLRRFYEDGFNRSLSTYFKFVDPQRFVSSAFFWICTPEGACFWHSISTLWQDFLRQQEQTGKARGHRRMRR